MAALTLMSGCQKAPPAATAPVPSAVPSGAASPVPEPTAPPSALPSAGATISPSPVPSPAESPTVSQEGAITRMVVPAGQRATAQTASGRRVTLAIADASDQALTVPVELQAATGATAAYRASAPTVTPPFPVAAGDLAASALSAPRSPMRHVAQTTSRTVGSSDSFWVNTGSFTPEGDRQQTAVLKRVSAHAYFYVDTQAAPVSETQLDQFVSTFESTIYPRVTGVFGEEAKPGVDGDDRLFIVFSPAVHDFDHMTDLLGYFWAPDAVPNPASGSHSNQKEVLFMSDRLFAASPLLAYGTLAHEFQHLINFTRKGPLLNYAANEATWLDEGMAMLSMEVAGYGLSAGEQLVATNIRDFESDPAAYALQDFRNNPNGYAFGQSYLFVRYLVDRYGAGVMKEIIGTPKRGQDAVEEVLERHGDSFVHFFQDWTIANVLSDTPASAGTPYHYQSLRLTGTYGPITLPGFAVAPASGTSFNAELRPWSTRYVRAEAPVAQPWRWTVTAPAAGRVVATAVAGS